MNFYVRLVWALLLAVTTNLVSAQREEPPESPTACPIEDLKCVNTSFDSQDDGTRIHSENAIPAPVYHQIVTRYRFTSAPISPLIPVTMDYMVHEQAISPIGLLVLIAGGQLNANIQGDANTGQVTNAGGNFLVRSAHLFRDQGFRVVAIDRPSDFLNFLGIPPSSSNAAFDVYRNDQAHLIDLKAVITAHKIANRPVYLVGTSRGAVSVVRWHQIANGISISSPVTSGPGTPLNSFGLTASDITVPTCVHWHVCDGCVNTTPANTQLYNNALSLNGFLAGGASMLGGFNHPNAISCEARTAHGFFGIESCAVEQIAQCLSSIITIPRLRLIFDDYFYPKFVPGGDPVRFSLRAAVEPQRGAGKLTFRLLDDSLVDSHGGRLAIKKNGLVTFLTPKVLKAATAKFVFEVTDRSGRIGIGVAGVNLVPDSRRPSRR